MGSGADIAKETGSMIITDDNFSTIVNGVEEGRHAYNNIRKVIYLLLSTGFSEVLLYALSILFGLPIPLTAIQLLWLNLISNGVQGDTLAFEKDTDDVMKRKQNIAKEDIINRLLLSEIAISATTMAVIEFAFYIYLIMFSGLEIETVRAYMLTLMVFMENVHIFNCRSEYVSCFKISARNNWALIASIVFTSVVQLAIVSIPSVAGFFGLSVIPAGNAAWLLVLTAPVIVVMEIFKRIA
jgi:magnesium-transporting ATPase (P-type)